MYDFHYNYIKEKYEDRAELLFTDTDSLCYELRTDDAFADMYDDRAKWFDLSDMKNAEFLDLTNKKVLGMFKDEMSGIPIKEAVCLRSKMYSLLNPNGEEKKVAKGVNKGVKDKELHHRLYKRVLQNESEMYHSMKNIRSYRHKIYTNDSKKRTLCAYDDKRYIQPDGIHTLAYGHYKID